MLFRLIAHLDAKRHAQIAVLLGMMVVGGLGEMATIGALVPLLAAVSAPNRVACQLPLIPCNTTLGNTLLVFTAVALLSGTTRIFLTWYSTRLSYSVGADLGLKIYRDTLHEPYSLHVKGNSSEVISDILKVDTVVAGVLYPGISVLVAGLVTAAILLALLRVDVAITSFTFLVFTCLYVGMYLWTHKQRARNSQIIADFDSRRIKSVQEGLGAIRDVLLDGAQRVYYEKFEFLNRTQRGALGRNSFINQYPRYVVETAGMLFIAAAAWIYARSEGNIASALPVLGALALGAQKLLPQIQMIYAGCSSIRGNFGLVEDVVERLDRAFQQPNFAEQTPECELMPESVGEAVKPVLELSHVSFSYSGDGPQVIKDVSLRLPRGCNRGFVGRTGSGKSTLFDVLMGLLPPTRGHLLFNGVRISPANVRALQDRVAHVPQSIFLADASIAENIAFGMTREKIDMSRVRVAAEQAQLADFILSLPHGYDTEVGERGIRLSGGQRQRIGIARALYKNAEILVLDEATSALDDATEARIIEAIRQANTNTTVLMIAHRTSTLAHCDLVYEIENGTIKRKGTYRELGLHAVAAAQDIPKENLEHQFDHATQALPNRIV